MCGICGFYGFEDRTILKRMCDVIKHRGPNDSGIYLDKNIGLGNRRLSIIDVAGGHQPIHNENESIWVTYNGEIYNYLEIKEDLEARGHQFYTNTDTETLVHAYEEFGENCLQKFRGMFAFALWDADKKQVFLARDRLGIKPLYYYFDGERLIFGSEIKSILQCGVPRRLDYNALHSYLSYRFVQGDSTIFHNIKKLPPGHLMLCGDKGVDVREYWDLKMAPQKNSEDYYLQQLKGSLKESVKLRLMSEVQLGAYLSGGIDSSTIVAIMSSLLDEPIKTFSVGFGDPNFDEFEYAQAIADHFGTEHHEFLVEPNAMELFPNIIWHFEEPIADPALFPTYILSEKAKKHVTVVLTGEGGDELFAGYEQYKIMALSEKYGRFLPKVIKTKAVPVVGEKMPSFIRDKLFRYSSLLGEEGIKRFSKYMSTLEDKGLSYLRLISVFDEEESRGIYTDTAKNEIIRNLAEELNKVYFKDYRKNELLNRLLYLEIKTSLQEHLLMKVDKMTMAHSIEARVPLLDHVVADLSTSLPQDLKLRGSTDKYILRKAAAELLPKKIINRKKQRFFVPIHTWLGGESKEYAMQILDSSVIKKRGYLKHPPIERMFRKFKDSKLYYSRQIWSLMALEFWHRIYMDTDELYRPDLSLDNLIS